MANPQPRLRVVRDFRGEALKLLRLLPPQIVRHVCIGPAGEETGQGSWRYERLVDALTRWLEHKDPHGKIISRKNNDSVKGVFIVGWVEGWRTGEEP